MRERRGYHRLGRRDLALGLSATLLGCARRDGTSSGAATSERAGGGVGPVSPASGAGGAGGAATSELPWGVMSGEVTDTSAVVWCRAERPGRMLVEWSTSPSFAGARSVVGPMATPDRDLTAVVRLEGLPRETRIHYRVSFEEEGGRRGASARGAFSTPQAPDASVARDVVFAWSGDINGQGWGIDDARGGMPAYRALADRAPDFFLCVGDAIYADNPIPKSIPLAGGGAWNNLVTEAKSHVAQTLDDFRGAFLYPRHAKEVRAFTAAVPTYAIWDDHEVRNNWFPGQVLKDEVYDREKHVDVLAAHARRAMEEHSPILPGTRTYRSFRAGPLLEVFLLDGRSYRTANEPVPEREAFLGEAQLAWLEDGLSRSTAVWKVVACDMPIGLVVSEPGTIVRGEAFDGFANGDGPPSGRELELARLFATLKRRGVRDVVWLTADVHYAAAHRYDPSRAAFKDADPFWEFVAGPLHATAFPRKRLDDTFGPEVVYASADGKTIGTPAEPSTQSFGVVRIDGATRTMTVTLVDGRGRDLHVVVLRPERRR